MPKERLNKTEVEIIRLFPRGETTVSDVSGMMKIDVSWASRSISHLEDLGFLSTNRISYKTYVSVADTPLGSSLSNLLIEESILNLDALIGDTALQILPLLIYPGYTTKEISERTGLTQRTVQNRIKRWRGMGIAIRPDDKYVLNPRVQLVIEFAEEYTRHRNLSHQMKHHPEAAIAWQYRDEYIISLDKEIVDSEYSVAGPTKVSLLGYDLVSRNYYYYHSPVHKEISEAEALVQTVKFNLNNSRPLRCIEYGIENKKVTKAELRKYAKKYDIEKRVEEAL